MNLHRQNHRIKHESGIIVVRKDTAILMQHRDDKPDIPYPDYWVYPAGSVRDGEDYEVAARRELTEETGYNPYHLFHLADDTYTRSDGRLVARHVYWTTYDGSREIQCNEGLEMKFVMLDEISKMKLVPGHERLFKLAVRRTKALLRDKK